MGGELGKPSRPMIVVGTLILLGTWGCSSKAPSPTAPVRPGPGKVVEAKPPANVLELAFPYGSEKKEWLDAVTEEFHRSDVKSTAGKQVRVKLIPMGSGELITDILEGRVKADLASPASSAFIELANADSQARTGRPLLGKTKNLLLSPVVIAMWKPMAEALGWGQQPIGWAEVLEMAKSEQGWAKYNYPQWGRFKFGHTHPEYSNSGLISLFAEVYAGSGKLKGLTLEDLQKPEVGQFLAQIERSVVHYGSSTGFFGKKMFAGGPGYLSAAVLYENMVIESYGAKEPLPFPVVAVYPKEGTFWSDHPVAVVEREWVDAERRDAAETYIQFLTATPQQQRAMQFGFRPADVAISLAAPIDAAHGVDPKQPKTTLEVPSASVAKATIDLWKKHKKHSRVVLLLDVSGSMKGEKIAEAKRGAEQFIRTLGDEDLLSFMPFNHQAAWAGQDWPMGAQRQRAIQAVGACFADGGTALYDAIAQAHRHVEQSAQPDRIVAMVVLSDGADTNSRMGLPQLLGQIAAQGEGANRAFRIFTIGYGSEAKKDVLTEIADKTNARFFTGNPDTIREVFKEIATFF